MASRYAYTYDERGFIVGETATESLAGYAWDEKHDGKHEDGRHDALYPHGNKHAKHGKDSTCAYRIVETVRTFTYDGAGKLLSATEKVEKTYLYAVENCLLAVYDGKELLMAAAYDGDGNRVFQLNYNLHTDGDLKGNNGNGMAATRTTGEAGTTAPPETAMPPMRKGTAARTSAASCIEKNRRGERAQCVCNGHGRQTWEGHCITCFRE